MSMYIPEIKEEVSESAKMLVEDGGKVVRTNIPKMSITEDSFNGIDVYIILDTMSNSCAATLVSGSYEKLSNKIQNRMPFMVQIVIQEPGENRVYPDTVHGIILYDGHISFQVNNSRMVYLNSDDTVECIYAPLPT